jgi:hypothetical protein
MTSRFLPWTVAIVLALVAGYLWYRNGQLQKSNKAQKAEMVELQTIQTELDEDYQTALESIESLRSDNQELNALIDNQKEELTAQKSKINNLIWAQRELGKAKEELANFEKMTAKYLAEISELKKTNDQLAATNVKLTNDNITLNESLVAEKRTSEELTEARAILVSEKEDLSNRNSALSEKVELGSAIKINWMSLDGGQVEDDGEFKRRKRTKKMDVIRTCFRTETNVVVPAGDETFYLRILNPTGETLSSEDIGSGIFSDKSTGQEMRYTMAGTLTYNNEDTEACMDWKPSSEVAKGNYTVEIYNKGYKVGTGTFSL